MIGWRAVCLVMLVGTLASAAVNSAYERVLTRHVRDARVDYAELKADPSDLQTYLNAVAAIREADFDSWSSDKQIAFLINVYNAWTLRLIIDHYPTSSIKKIGRLLKGPWDQPIVRLFGKELTLNHIEHEILRKRYQEPRIHFALVCAAKGCPPLRPEPYTEERLDHQLKDQGEQFLRDMSKNHLDRKSNVLYLSPIFRWFKNDFTDSTRTLEALIGPYLTQPDAQHLLNNRVTIQFTEYDWSLNGTP